MFDKNIPAPGITIGGRNTSRKWGAMKDIAISMLTEMEIGDSILLTKQDWDAVRSEISKQKKINPTMVTFSSRRQTGKEFRIWRMS